MTIDEIYADLEKNHLGGPPQERQRIATVLRMLWQLTTEGKATPRTSELGGNPPEDLGPKVRRNR